MKNNVNIYNVIDSMKNLFGDSWKQKLSFLLAIIMGTNLGITLFASMFKKNKFYYYGLEEKKSIVLVIDEEEKLIHNVVGIMTFDDDLGKKEEGVVITQDGKLEFGTLDLSKVELEKAEEITASSFKNIDEANNIMIVTSSNGVFLRGEKVIDHYDQNAVHLECGIQLFTTDYIENSDDNAFKWRKVVYLDGDTIKAGYVADDYLLDVDLGEFEGTKYKICNISKENNLKLREKPGLQSDIVCTMKNDEVVHLIPNVISEEYKNGILWKYVAYNSADGIKLGWCAEGIVNSNGSYVRYLDKIINEKEETNNNRKEDYENKRKDVKLDTLEYNTTSIDLGYKMSNNVEGIIGIDVNTSGITEDAFEEILNGSYNLYEDVKKVGFVNIKLGATGYGSWYPQNIADEGGLYEHAFKLAQICEKKGIPYSFYYFVQALPNGDKEINGIKNGTIEASDIYEVNMENNYICKINDYIEKYSPNYFMNRIYLDIESYNNDARLVKFTKDNKSNVEIITKMYNIQMADLCKRFGTDIKIGIYTDHRALGYYENDPTSKIFDFSDLKTDFKDDLWVVCPIGVEDHCESFEKNKENISPSVFQIILDKVFDYGSCDVNIMTEEKYKEILNELEIPSNKINKTKKI